MSQVVDTKVVEMQFDNSKFEKNIEVSLNSLKFLNKSIEDAGKGRSSLDELAHASDQVGLSFDNMSAKSRISISLMDMLAGVGTRAFNKISDAVAGFAMNMANSLSGMQAMRDGFAEYELKMGSVQTILMGAKIIDPKTGKNLEDTTARLDIVNEKLEELNTYSDKTIYSFKDMTANIGKFTNAGVNLDDAVGAIQGVANVAAISGANASEASRAMYNFSQALSSGAVKLIDWKSIENANMATMDFKQQLLDTAVALGTVTKEGNEYITTTTNAQGKVSEAFNATKGFNDSLSHQWMTTEVLTQTLRNYSTDVREMTDAELEAYKAQLKSVGYTEQQVEGIVKLSEKAFDAATEVKTFSQMIDTLKESLGSGWAQSFEIIFGNFSEAKKLWTDLNNAIDGILSPIGKARNEILKMWKADGGRDAMIQSFANLYHAVENLLAPIKELWKAFTPNTSNAGKILATIFKWIEKLTAAVAKAAEKIGKAIAFVLKPAVAAGNWIGQHLIKLVGIIRNSFGKIVDFFSPLGQAIRTFASGIKEAFDKNIVTRIANVRTTLGQTFKDLKKNVGESSVVKKLSEAFTELKNTLLELFGRAALNAGNFASRFVGYFGRIWKAIQPFISSATSSVVKSLADFVLPKLSKAITWVVDRLRQLANALKKLNIKDTKFYKGITELPDRLADLSKSKAFRSLKSFAASVKNFGKEAIAYLSDRFKDLKVNIDAIHMPKGLSDLFSNVKDFIRKIFGGESVGDKVAKVGDSLQNAGAKVGELTNFQKFLKFISTAFESVRSSASRAFGVVKSFVDFIKANVPKALRGIYNFFAGDDGIMTMEDFTDAIYNVSFAFSSLMKSIGLMNAGNAVASLSGSIGDSFANIANATVDLMKKTSNKMNVEAMKNFAIAIGILAGSLFLLSMVSWDKLLPAASVLVALGGAFTFFFSKVSQTSADLSKTVAFLPIAATLVSLSLAMLAAVAALGALVGALALFPKVIKSYNKLGDDFRQGMERVKEVLGAIFEYLASLSKAKFGFRGAAALLGLVFALDKMRSNIVKYASKETAAAMEEGLKNIQKVLDVLGKFMNSTALASFNGINIGINFNTLGIAAMIWAVGNMLKNISAPMKMMSEFTPSEFENALSGVEGVLTSLLKFVGTITLMLTAGNMMEKSGPKAGQLLGFTAMIAVIGSTISSIVSSLKTLTQVSTNNPDGYTKAILSLKGIFVSLDILFAVIGLMKPANVAGTLFALTIAISALTACVVALTPIAASNPGALIGSVAALGGLMIALGVAVRLASSAGEKTTLGDIIKIIAITGAMFVLTESIRRLSKAGGDATSIASAGAAIGIAVMSMAAAMHVMNGLTLNPLVLAGLALLTAAIWGIAFAIKWFKQSAGDMEAGAAEIEKSAPKMKDAMEPVADEMANGLADALPKALQNMTGAMGKEGGLFKGLFGDINFGDMLKNMVAGLKEQAASFGQDFIEIGTNLIDGISQAISNPSNVEKVKQSFKALGQALLDSFKLFFGINSPSTVMAEQGNFIIDGLVQGLMNFPGKIAGWVAGIGSSILGGITGFFSGAIEKGKTLIDNIGTGIQSAKDAVAKKAGEVGKAALDKVGKANEWVKSATKSANAFGSKLAASKNPIKASAGRMIVGATTVIGTLHGVFSKSASTSAKVFAAQINSGASPARAAGKALVAGAKAAFDGIKNSFQTFGKNAAEGFKNGINNMISSIASKAAEMVRKAKQAAKNEQHSNSPSKDFMEFGDWAAQGYAIGLINQKSTRLIEANAQKMVATAKNAASVGALGSGSLYMNSDPAMRSLAFAMAQISDALDDNLDSSPTIRPVVDMSNVNRNASAISSLFGDQNVSANLNAVASAQNGFENSQASRNNALSAAAINKLTNRIASMTDTMNSRSLNNYITVDGASDPEAFADDLIRSFRLNARTV